MVEDKCGREEAEKYERDGAEERVDETPLSAGARRPDKEREKRGGFGVTTAAATFCLTSKALVAEWLPRKDSNLDKEIQNLSCYRYTTRHRREEM